MRVIAYSPVRFEPSAASIIQPAAAGKTGPPGGADFSGSLRPASTKLLLHKRAPEPLYFRLGGRHETRRRLKSDTDKGHPARKPGAQSR
jgi:hypothetical protein